MNRALTKPGVPFVLAGGVLFAIGILVSPTKHYERLALFAAVLGATAEAIRMIVT